jgi:FK506-binding protein 1
MSGLQKKLVKEGNKSDYPKTGDTVTMEYTGWLFDPSAPDNRGNKSV